jgi:hypothetical protein
MRKDIPKYGTPAWGLYQYEQAKIAKRGHNYQYYNESIHEQMLNDGWDWYKFNDKYEQWATSSELLAKEIVDKLRSEGNYARIIAGYSQNPQKIKMFSVIYKSKKK